MTAIRSIGIPLVLLSTLFLLQACGGGGGGGGDASEASSDLVLLDVNVDGTTGVPLNTVLKITFSEVLDPDSVRPETVQIRQGPNFGIQVPGRLLADGRDVYFSPRLPVDGDYEDSGFQPGTSYKVVLPGAPKVATVRSFSGDRLVREFEASFGTADSDGPLFIDNFLDPGPPQVTSVSPVDEAPDVSADSEITLVFKRRPLDPATVNSDTISVRLLERDGIVLDRPVEGTPVLEQTRESVHVTWKPRYPLASRAKYRISVSRFIVDLVGFDLVPHESTFTTRDELLRPGELVLEFDAPEGEQIVDTMVTTASWGTEVPGEMTALFTAAGGSGTAGDFRPNKDVEVSAEDFPNGVGVETIDGVETDVFNFREIDIPAGVTARFVRRPSGPNRPIALLALKNITIDGTLSVEGGKGESSESTYISNFSLPSADGGLSGPGGADGAARYAGSLNRSHPPADASDAPQGGGGGGGGFTGTGSTVYSASSGGGGGGSRTAGEDGGPAVPSSTSTWYAKVGGAGGDSASSRGFGPNLERRPNIGGAGGGAGGNGYYALTSSSSRSRNGAGTGGGGGGAVTIQSASDVVIGPEGKIDASGGNGGDIQSGMLAYYGGAGGGGGGGSARLRATGGLVLSEGAGIDVAGGAGGRYLGTSTFWRGGEGGDGGEGFLRLEAGVEESTGFPRIDGVNSASLTYPNPSTGEFAPKGAGAPSVGQTKWINLGVFDPEMIKPGAGDTVATLLNDSLMLYVQMAVEDPRKLGEPDLSAMDIADADSDGERDDSRDERLLSEWTRLRDVEELNGLGYSFLRVRLVFQLDENQGPKDPLPSISRLRIPYEF